MSTQYFESNQPINSDIHQHHQQQQLQHKYEATTRRMSYSSQPGLKYEEEGEPHYEQYQDVEMPQDSSIHHASAESELATADSSVVCHSDGSYQVLTDEATLIRQTELILGVDWKLHQEIFMNMQKSEKKHRIYNDQSKYLKHRRIIVDWMCEVGEEFKLGPLTIHCSVRFLDRVLSSLDVAKNRLQLVAMACILIASKHEETEDVTPTLNELNECSNNAYSIDALKEMEVSVLRHLGWQLALITPIHFLQFYQARGIIFHTDLFEGGPSNRKSALKYVRKYADFFAELCLQEYSFQQYLPSVMAAAVIAAARRAVKIDPIWNSGLEGLTTYNEKDIFPAYKQLYNYYTESFPTAPHVYPSPRSVVEFEARGGAAL